MLKKEIKQKQLILKNREIVTIYLGGGTPSIVDPQLLVDLLQMIRSECQINKNAEISIEVNPESINAIKLQLYRKAGINRISLGVQALDAKTLKFLGRSYSPEQVIEAVKMIQEAGFENFGLDLIYSLPGQTLQLWKDTLRQAIELKSQHLSCYSLELAGNTAFVKAVNAGELKPVSAGLDSRMYKFTRNFLLSKGWQQDEISNYSRPGFVCKHNADFWHYQDYLGLGAGAHSFIQGKRFSNLENINQYLTGKDFQSKPVKISIKKQMQEYLILGLRTSKGISGNDFNNKFKKNLFLLFAIEIKRLKDVKLLKLTGKNLLPTVKGMYYWNEVAREMVLGGDADLHPVQS